MDRTLVVIKPDGVGRSLIGQVVSRFEQKGFRIIRLEMFRFSQEKAREFYSPHLGKPFFPELEKFITSGPVVGIVLEGNKSIETVRSMIGSTKAFEAASGTIRGDFSLGITDNIVHASDSQESFDRESKIIFPELN